MSFEKLLVVYAFFYLLNNIYYRDTTSSEELRNRLYCLQIDLNRYEKSNKELIFMNAKLTKENLDLENKLSGNYKGDDNEEA